MVRGRAVIISAPCSGSGKTMVTLALLALARKYGLEIRSAKVGPDYIDPQFHEYASGKPCISLDPWAMPEDFLRLLAAEAIQNASFLLIEGVMGLFDGASGGGGTTADVAALLDLPVILVIDASRQGQSVAALVQGFSSFQSGCRVGGLVFNRVSSSRHENILRRAVASSNIPVLACLPDCPELSLPSRHLGLVQAREISRQGAFFNKAAEWIEAHVDFDAFVKIALPVAKPNVQTLTSLKPLSPLGNHMAIALDDAFSFVYPHLLSGWRQAGAELSFFSPLADEEPAPRADAIFLPGGYPELHAARLSTRSKFFSALRQSAGRSLIYGECGGFMVLGDFLITADGTRHEMAGLLPMISSFVTPRLTLGYRRFSHDGFLPWPASLRGHEFHYSTVTQYARNDSSPLFQATESTGTALPPMGIRSGHVAGSYAHVIAADEGRFFS